MELKIYNGEIFEKGIKRYIGFIVILILLLVLSISYNNAPGAILLLIFMGGYFYYSSNLNKKTVLKINENGLSAGEKIYPRTILKGYCLEVNIKNGEIKNIVILTKEKHHIYTISDTMENLKLFIQELEKYTHLETEYSQTFREKIIRKLEI